MNQFQPLLINHVDFGECHQAVPDVQKGADLHVFAGLWHHPLVGGNDHADDVDARGAGDHVFDEFFVARHIDDTQAPAAGQIQGGKPQFDGDAAKLFLLEPVGVGAGKGFDEAGFAVVNMAGGAENDRFHNPRAPAGVKVSLACGF